MNIDRNKFLKMLERNRKSYSADKVSESCRENYGDALMSHSAECTIENIILAIKSGKYDAVPEVSDE